jgi:mono/diheme cytochrome c family protein
MTVPEKPPTRPPPESGGGEIGQVVEKMEEAMKTLALSLALAVGAGCAAGTPPAVPPAPVSTSAAQAAMPMSSPAEFADRTISPEAGADYFLRTGVGDPYATGMAYPVFLALMEAYPDALGSDWNAFADRFGFIRDPAAKGDPKALPVGFHLTTDPATHVPWVVTNCQMCHAERLRLESGDVVVPGLGNKRARPHAYASALLRIGADPAIDVERIDELATQRAADWGIPWAPEMRRPIVKATVAGLKALASRTGAQAARYESALPGRMATIESFAIALDPYLPRPIPLEGATGWAKVPDVASFPYRDTFSYDGSGYGSPQALVLDASFVFGTRPEWYVAHPQIATSMYLYLHSFRRDLRYPGAIDEALAARGHDRFETTCSRCHGSYEKLAGETRALYRERIVPLDVVGTDPARADAVTPAFVEAANAFPLTRGLAQVRHTGGYVPPVLVDVWARGLFGHAGQWPSLEVLGMAPEKRPKRFIVDTEGKYDLERVGVRYEVPAATRALRPGEYEYDGGEPGLGVGGHPFLANLAPEDRRAVIEYLKTL